MADTEKKLRILWSSMKTRCSNKNRIDYMRYGGRGITVSEEWLKVDNFLKDMGKAYKSGLTLERRDNNKGYSKNNCYWATIKEQANNRRTNRFITWKGLTKTLTQWAEYLGIKRSTLAERFYVYKWNIDRCFTYKGGYQIG